MKDKVCSFCEKRFLKEEVDAAEIIPSHSSSYLVVRINGRIHQFSYHQEEQENVKSEKGEQNQ